jgi:hypothetical protein
VIGRRGLLGHHVECRTGDPAGVQLLQQSVEVDQAAPRHVHQVAALPHLQEPVPVDQVGAFGGQGKVQGNDVALSKDLIERGSLYFLGPTTLVQVGVVADHPPKAGCRHRDETLPDASQTDDAECQGDRSLQRSGVLILPAPVAYLAVEKRQMADQ